MKRDAGSSVGRDGHDLSMHERDCDNVDISSYFREELSDVDDKSVDAATEVTLISI